MKSKKNSLEKKCLFYRKQTDYSIKPKSYIIMMLDGKKFSTYTRSLNKPFDEGLIEDMNETAKFLCQNIEGCKFAYTQSDEISLFIADYENKNTQQWMQGRLCKLLSIAPSMATAKFNQLRTKRLSTCRDVSTMNLAFFDVKVWSVPTQNDVFAWFLYRQNDCVRNSISMLAQSKFSHNQLLKKDCNEMQEMLKEKFNISWEGLNDGLKYGRFIYKCEVNEYSEKYQKNYIRNRWCIHLGRNLNIDNQWLRNMIPFNEFSNENKWWFKLQQKLIKLKNDF